MFCWKREAAKLFLDVKARPRARARRHLARGRSGVSEKGGCYMGDCQGGRERRARCGWKDVLCGIEA